MELLHNFVDLFLHLDEHLADVISRYGVWTYGVLFAIIFCETGLVVMPLLPGDSLLFAAGSMAAIGSLNPHLLFVLLWVAGVLGDTVNYWVGNKIGHKIVGTKWVKQAYLDKTHSYFEKYGGKTIVIARFVPIVRTFAPFVAGLGAMTYSRFLFYNVAGGALWVSSLVYAGYFFGNIPVVKKHFEIVILAIIFISILPGIIEVARARWSRAEPV